MIVYNFCPQCKTKTDKSGEYPKCPKCNITFYKNSKPTTGVLPIKDGKVLLAIRAEEPFKGTLDIIGGFLKAGEHPIEGVHRELMEETGMKVKIIDLLGIYTDFYAATGDHTQNTFYIGELSNGKPKIMDDISDLKWIRIDELGKHGDEVGFQCIKDALRDLRKWYKTGRGRRN